MIKIDRNAIDDPKLTTSVQDYFGALEGMSEEDQIKFADHYGDTKMCLIDFIGLVYGVGAGAPIDLLLTEITDDNTESLFGEFTKAMVSNMLGSGAIELDDELKTIVESELNKD